MSLDEDLQQLRLKISRIETELSDAKYQLTTLDERVNAFLGGLETELQSAPLLRPGSTLTPVVFSPLPPQPSPQVVPDVSPQIVPAAVTPAVMPIVMPLAAPVVASTTTRSVPPPMPVQPPVPPAFEAHAAEVEPAFFDAQNAAQSFVPAPRHREVEPEPAAESSVDWKLWLQRLQLWPPADGQNNEVRLGAWWATRLGAFLAVIGVVFFGVYVSLNTPPWIKFAELCAICAGVAVAGLWLEKRIARFGAVVFAGGLALVYFCAFAGYALPAVKVLTSPAAAVGWQLAAVLLITGASISRRSQSIATMAVGLGFVTAIFSRAGGLHDFALVTAALLAVASVVFHRWLCWEGPSVVALPGAYAVYYLVLEGNWLRGGAPSAVWPWLFLAGVSTLFFARDWRSVRVGNAAVGVGEKWFQGANSSLAVLLGVVTAFMLFRGDLAEFYFGAAFMLGVFAWLRRAQVEDDVMSAVFVAKASGALTLGVIEVVDGRTTALALLVQAWVMLFCARQLKSRVLAVGTGLVAMVAAFYFFRDAMSEMPLWSMNAAGALAFVVGFAWLPSVARRVLSADYPGQGEGFTLLESLAALVASAAALVTVFHVRANGWEPALMVGVAAVLGLPVLRRIALAPLWAACVMLLAANGALWLMLENSGNPQRMIMNSVIVLIHGVWIGAWCGVYRRKSTGDLRESENEGTDATASTDASSTVVSANESGSWALLGLVIWGITLLGVAHGLSALAEPVVAFGSTLLIALTLGLFAPLWRGRGVLWLAVFTSALGSFFWESHTIAIASWPWLVVALGAAWALPIALHASRRHRATLEKEPQEKWLIAALLGLAINETLRALPAFFTGDAQIVACAVVALAVFGLSIWPRVALALEASWVLWSGALVFTAQLAFGKSAAFGHNPLPLLFVALLSWVQVVALSRRSGTAGAATSAVDSAWWRREATGVQTVLATLLTVLVCAYSFDGAAQLVALVVGSVAVVLLARFGRISEARWSSLALLTSAAIASWFVILFGGVQGWGEGMAAVLLVAGALIAVPLVVIGDVRKAGKIIHIRWWFGAVALAQVFALALVQHGTLAPYATVGWGLASIVVFMTGLFARARPYRMLGLLGLALCVPRMFVVDLDSVLHRIAAFVVLGLVLLWVGFSYHRFRHLITEESDGSKSP